MPQEYVARWVGGRIGAGATVLHFKSIAGPSQATAIATNVRALFNTLAAVLPDDVTINFDSEVRELADDGTLTAVYPVAAPAAVTGSGVGVFSNGTGILVRHSTGTIFAGRRLLGRTFLVPATGTSFNGNGDVLAATVTLVNNAFATLRTSMTGGGAEFAVWSRTAGQTSSVIQSVTQARPTTLRTRNDRL